MAARTKATNPFEALLALAPLAQALSAMSAPSTPEPTKKTKVFNVPEGFRAVTVLTPEEIVALAAAVKSGEAQKVVVGNRETFVRVIPEDEVLDNGKNAREALRGSIQVARRTIPQA